MLFIYNDKANRANTYLGLHNHMGVHSKEYASLTRLACNAFGKNHPCHP